MKTVFITGASSGIGAALARAYAEQGATLGLLARRQEVLEELRQSLPDPGKHHIYAVDVTDHAALSKAATDFMQAVGQVNVVIANAGISVGTLSEYADDIQVFDSVLQTNLMATVATFSPFINPMKTYAQSADCRLVGIGSVAGIRGLPGAGAYCASKAAVISYCESLRVELRGSGIQVVTIAPGYIDTPMTRGNPYPMPFLMPVQAFCQAALKAIASGSSYRVIPWQMGVVAKLLRSLPNWLYDAAFARAARKPRASDQ
ncbi:SDR family oxidoreductase [Undibacterium sp. TS12]|uniref:SDR family oxidoreductase n=1 Tax=Undibacterium sp. TS12 TaxID=2908202 RepID=UPI001F4D11D2|nr:SDR family oxidoreductase [Undibacterium sp. TS12]MCH8621784.1 SDR family oxidoreductase [Undibacterium sp. TS12]